jgi:hypothetical protein
MSGGPGRVAQLLDRAAAARGEGDPAAARAAYLAAYEAAKAAEDTDAMTEAALGLAAGHRFGTHAGRVPAFLHETYLRTHGAARSRLAVALARLWVYANDPQRAVPFAAEAIAEAERIGDVALLAEALDAQLLVSWGPDDFDERVRITARLEAVVAHLADVEARMSAHLWRLTTALESLDAVAVGRQLRALETLAGESGSARVRFFAASRRGMYALVVGDLAAAEQMITAAAGAGTEAGEADTEAIGHTLAAALARQRGDRDALNREALAYEEFGIGEGVPSVAAEAAALWLAGGSADRARSLLGQVAGADFAAIPRDVDWLLTVATLTEVAARTGAADLTDAGIRLLEPYAGRGIVNGGAVAFAGVVDDYLGLAHASLGHGADAQRCARAAAAAYDRLGASWWRHRLEVHDAAPTGVRRYVLCPGPAGLWTVGPADATVSMRDMKGLTYLRLLLLRPGVDVPALDLSELAGGRAAVVQAGLGELVDRQALTAYRQRLADLDADLDEAHRWADQGRIARAQAERDALVHHLAAAAGLHGRRRLVGGTAERARVAVRKAISAAVERIDTHDPALARLLRDTVRTGSVCRYEPDPGRPVTWMLDET